MKSYKMIPSLIFILGFFIICYREMQHLPTLISSINTVLGTRLSTFVFFFYILLFFSILPLIFSLTIFLLGLRYRVFEMKEIAIICAIVMKKLYLKIYDAVFFLIVFWILNFPYEPEEYYFLYFAHLVPTTPKSNIYAADAVSIFLTSMAMFYFYITFHVALRINEKYPNIKYTREFYIKNWPFIFCIVIITIYHIWLAELFFRGMILLDILNSRETRQRHMNLLGCAWLVLDKMAVLSQHQ